MQQQQQPPLVSLSSGAAGGAGSEETGHKNRARRRRAWRSVKVCVCATSPARCHVFLFCFFFTFFYFYFGRLAVKDTSSWPPPPFSLWCDILALSSAATGFYCGVNERTQRIKAIRNTKSLDKNEILIN